LMEANATQTEAPLAEVESLLRTLLDAWTEAAAGNAMPAADSEMSLAGAFPLSAAG